MPQLFRLKRGMLMRDSGMKVRAGGTTSERRSRRRVGACFVLYCGLVASAPGCSSSPSLTRCDEYLTESKESPERRYTAAAFQRVCGVRPNIIHVNLYDGLGEPPPVTHQLITSGEVFSFEGGPKVDIIWQDAKTLLIKCIECDERKILKRESTWKDVRVTFTAK